MLEQIARVLCKADGKNPDQYWEEFDHNAAASMFEAYEGWEDDVFPKFYAWYDYTYLAQAVVDYLEKTNVLPSRTR